ncbi:MAG: NAD(+) diphosphatase [Christensenellales bacterium]|jgi:NAD+ diphosphatase
MIQDIVPHRYDNTYKIQTPHAQDILLYYQKQDVLCQHTEQGDTLPRFELFADEVKEKAQYLFSIDDVGFYLVKQLEIPEGKGLFMQPTRVFRNFEPQWMAFGGITGSQIYRWERAHKFCGKCGSVMKDSETERAQVCTKCGYTEYPKISPAIIVAIRHGEKLLMARNVSSPPGKFALIAGFVEIGESFEQTVRREAMEEVGIKVKNIQYYKSQPWSFSDTVMIGFTAELDGEDETLFLQESELAEAHWFTREEVPEPTSYASIGSELINNFRLGK